MSSYWFRLDHSSQLKSPGLFNSVVSVWSYYRWFYVFGIFSAFSTFSIMGIYHFYGLPWELHWHRIHQQCRRPQFDSQVTMIPWRRDRLPTPVFMGFPDGSDSKESACNAGDLGSILELGRSPGGGHGNPLQCSCLENPHGQRSVAGCSPWGHKE